jgi:mannose/fructose/N-acetylgalactosamine-specific phosphotransferase system component IID
MPRTDDSAAYAANWRTVLAVDAALGVVLSLAGAAVGVLVNFVLGLTLVVAGAAYTALVGVRARRWSRLRQSGLR